LKKYFFILNIVIGLAAGAQNNKADGIIQRGNDHYRKQEYQEAINEYQKALNTDPGSLYATFNMANAAYLLDQKVEAAKLLTGMLVVAEDKGMRNRVFYNKGVILSSQKNIEGSIEAYENALRNDPNDKEARENLQKALLELKKKNPPKKEENKNNKKQQQQKQPQSKMDQKQTQQRLQLLQQKERQVQERIQGEKNKGAAGSRSKDW
jgi:tetratricopeptide (TPR) repeat protein